MLRTMILAGVVLALAGSAMGDVGLSAVRDEIADLRSDLPTRALENPRAARLATRATERLVDALAVIDEGDEDRMPRMFRRLAQAVRLMGRAARAEKSEAFEEYVSARGGALWNVSARLFTPENPAIVDPDLGPLEAKLAQKVRRAGRRASVGRYAGALSRLRPAWRVRLKLDRVP